MKKLSTPFLFTLLLLTTGCATAPEALELSDLETLKELDRQICLQFPEERPMCLFAENESYRTQYYSERGIELKTEGDEEKLATGERRLPRRQTNR